MQYDQQLRYSRHLLLDEWSEAAQERLLRAHAIVIGAGGLGAPALMYLAAAGVGRITVVDPDTVELSNLQRQIAHTTASVGQPKVESAARTLAALNPDVTVHPVAQAADEAWLAAHLPGADVVLDCTDAFATRQRINRAARAAGVPLVTASALRWDGQLSVFDPRDPDSPCYACLFPPRARTGRNTLRADGRVRPAGRAGGRDAGRRSDPAAGGSDRPWRCKRAPLAQRLAAHGRWPRWQRDPPACASAARLPRLRGRSPERPGPAAATASRRLSHPRGRAVVRSRVAATPRA